MYYVYLLIDEEKKLYIGSTGDLRERVKRHIKGTGSKTTRKYKNPKLYYYEAYIDEEMARVREMKLKQFGSSYAGLMKRIGLK